ncbi:MAG: hypothetical protein D6753_04390 [Planctomycetota bacterium]|nr:MAG: hypothetical protein D6753_04390 [Planctomycetota bacterium]
MFPNAGKLHLIHRCLAGLAVGSLLTGGSNTLMASEAQRFDTPVRVYAASDQAILRCGPGPEFYGTMRLPEGQELEVYVQTDDGWLGVRPPEGSHCWIPARTAYLLPGGRVVEVTTPGTVSWIGSEIEKPPVLRWQVELTRGEQLAVLGETTHERSDGQAELWYKVAPPSGEFRWIHQSDVSYDAPPQAHHGDGSRGSASRESAKDVAAKGSGIDPAVQPAQYEEVVVGESIVVSDDGEVIAEGSILEEPWEDNIVYEDDIVYEDGAIVTEPQPLVDPRDPTWEGWHAFDFEFPKLRLPLLHRLFGHDGTVPVHDPLVEDPYSLEVAAPARHRVVHPPSPAIAPHRRVPTVHAHPSPSSRTAPTRRRTPWRDPRDLRQRRLQGEWGGPDTIPTPRALVDAIRANVEGIRSAASAPHNSSDLHGGWQPNGVPPASAMSAAPNAHATPPSTPQSQWYGIDATAGRMVAASTPALEANPQSGLDENKTLEALRIALSEEVTKPSGTWNLAPIRAEIIRLIEHGTSPLLRGQARLLLERLDEFQNHAQRSAMLGVPLLSSRASIPPSDYSLQQVTPAGGVPPSSTMGSSVITAGFAAVGSPAAGQSGPVSADIAPGQQPFDATGILIPVFSHSAAQPQYALAADSGQIVAYVTPLAGMKLDHYLNQAVGVRGLRGYLPQLQANHIQAERVVRLR